MSEMHQPLPPPAGPGEVDIAEFGRRYRASVERARQHYERNGTWPPDPLLDEVRAARREILAEHGGDWSKVLDSYVELDKKNPERFVGTPHPVGEKPSAA